MRYVLAICLSLALYVAPARAQQPPLAGDWPMPPDDFSCGYDNYCCPPTVTARLEYLMWWSRGRNTPPLVTTSPQDTPRDEAGVLGFAATTVLYGDESIGEDFRSGGRLSASYMFEDCLWVEARLWGLEDSSETFLAVSDGNPILARPFFNVVLGQEDSLLVAFPGVTTDGRIAIQAKNDLFGAEASLRETWSVDCGARIDVLAGYQFTRLVDSLAISNRQTSIDPNGTVPVGTVIENFDAFVAQNEFHGGQLGLAGEYQGRCWSLELLGKVALGAMHEPAGQPADRFARRTAGSRHEHRRL